MKSALRFGACLMLVFSSVGCCVVDPYTGQPFGFPLLPWTWGCGCADPCGGVCGGGYNPCGSACGMTCNSYGANYGASSNAGCGCAAPHSASSHATPRQVPPTYAEPQPAPPVTEDADNMTYVIPGHLAPVNVSPAVVQPAQLRHINTSGVRHVNHITVAPF